MRYVDMRTMDLVVTVDLATVLVMGALLGFWAGCRWADRSRRRRSRWG